VLERITSLGGGVVQAKTAIPGMGYFGYFRDTEGNVLGLWTTAPDAA
jgi:predicted enzyme related to lactoylglutathione lyase